MNYFTKKIGNLNYSKEKIRFLLFALVLLLTLFLARYLLGMAYARYEVRTKINANIDKALYIFEDDSPSFNLEPSGIIPSDTSYSYKFSVSNYNATKRSDVDINYKVIIRTTTNLPITVRLYRNEDYTTSGATNIISNPVVRQDVDGAYYRVYESSSSYDMAYADKVTDIYTIVVDFPSVYAANPVYANYLENIEVTLESEQII